MRIRDIALMSALCVPTLAGAQVAGDPTGGTATGGTATGGTATGDPTGGPAAGVSVFPLQAGDGVSFGQVVFELDSGATRSAWGRIEVDPVRISRTLGEPAGFVNVRFGGEWVALNVPVDTNPRDSFPRGLADAEIMDDGGSLPVVQYFDLGSTRGRLALYATVVFSTEPLMQVADFENLGSLPTSRFSVAKISQTLSHGTDLDAPGPDPLPPPPMNPQFALPDPLIGYWARMTPNPVNIESARNQCVPIAVANALSYMRLSFGASRGFAAPHSATKGVRNGGTFSIAEEMDERMRRPTVDTCNGSGTGYCPDYVGDSSIYAGVARYLSLWNDVDRLRIRVQGSQSADCFPDLEVDTAIDAPEVTFDWLCDHIAAGDGITITYNRYSVDDQGDENYTGAHAVRVHGCGVMGGRTFIRVLNDTKQDGMTEGLCEERDGLESQMVYVEDLDNDGRLNYADNPLREIVFAMAISIDP